MKFPESIPISDSVQQSRIERRKRMISTASRGVLIRGAIVLAELMGFVFLSSSALLLDALSSLVDIASSLFLIFCIRFADKPPDKDHPFGHGRFEPIAGLQLGIFLSVIGGGMLFQQISVLLRSEHKAPIDPHTWIIPLCAVVLLESCYRSLKATAQRENSPALLADAIHYRIDGVNSLFATIALFIASYLPNYSVMIDHLGAVVIAVLMIGIGAIAARSNVHQLLDRAPDESYFDRVRKAAMRVKGVLGTEKLRLQVYGPDAHVNIDVEVDPTLSVEEAHEISQKVRSEIQISWPAVRDVIVHIEPFYEGDHEG